jgi:hypothetical protein
MDRDQYNELKSTGGLVADAALQDESAFQQEEIDDQEQDRDLEEEQDQQHEEVTDEEHEEDDLPPLNEKEKSAFEKRMERERTKLQQKLEEELKQQYEQQYGKHKSVIDLLGGDVEAIEKRIREQKFVSDAQRLADQNGWDDEQTRWYIEDQRNKQELKELRVQMQINRLRDNPDYAGISSMEREIAEKIDKTNGALTVEEAYWALGGKNKADQIRLEAQVREAEKRKKQPRTVLTDSPTSGTAEKPLPPEVMREAERMGISASEARRLMNNEPAKDLADWRKRKQAK